MGLYLCIFDEDEEIDGVEVGGYADFNRFRDCIARHLEKEGAGSRFPTLNLHSDCDGEWSPSEAERLEKELVEIGDEFRRRQPIAIEPDWQKHVIRHHDLQIGTLYDCFFDVDGEPLIERLAGLARRSRERRLPILFQ
jgi:hypothetical protein